MPKTPGRRFLKPKVKSKIKELPPAQREKIIARRKAVLAFREAQREATKDMKSAGEEGADISPRAVADAFRLDSC